MGRWLKAGSSSTDYLWKALNINDRELCPIRSHHFTVKCMRQLLREEFDPVWMTVDKYRFNAPFHGLSAVSVNAIKCKETGLEELWNTLQLGTWESLWPKHFPVNSVGRDAQVQSSILSVEFPVGFPYVNRLFDRKPALKLFDADVV